MSNLISGLDKWNERVTENFCPMSCSLMSGTDYHDFNGLITNRSFYQGNLSQVASKPIVATRSKQDIAKLSDADAYYLVKFQMKGQGLVRQKNREAHLNVGDFVICSTSEPYHLEFNQDYQQTVFSIPQTILQNMFHSPDDFLGMRMGSEVATHGIISHFVHSVIQRIDMLEPEALQSMEANLLNLLITSLKTEQKSIKSDNQSERCSDMHLRKIKRFIAMNIKDYHLSVDFIAQSENISKRYLHMLFQKNDMSVSRYIQQLRLEGCYNDLINREFNAMSTSDIALDWGFGDISHFYRRFKEKYSITPKQLRINQSK